MLCYHLMNEMLFCDQPPGFYTYLVLEAYIHVYTHRVYKTTSILIR